MARPASRMELVNGVRFWDKSVTSFVSSLNCKVKKKFLQPKLSVTDLSRVCLLRMYVRNFALAAVSFYLFQCLVFERVIPEFLVSYFEDLHFSWPVSLYKKKDKKEKTGSGKTWRSWLTSWM